MSSIRDQIANAASNGPKVQAPTGGNATAEKPAKAPKTPKVAVDCKCEVPNVPGTNGGCNGGKTNSNFAPGHDAKMVGYLTREVVAGKMTTEQAVAKLSAASGASKTLIGKLTSAIPREQANAAGAAKREADKQAAKDAKAAKDQLVKDQIAAAKADKQAADQAK